MGKQGGCHPVFLPEEARDHGRRGNMEDLRVYAERNPETGEPSDRLNASFFESEQNRLLSGTLKWLLWSKFVSF